MKQYSGNIWTEEDSRGVVKIGFAQRYIEEQLGECFHVIQADTRTVKKGTPLMVLETNDGTTRIKSPLSGTIVTFSDKARNFPDRLSEEDVIIEVLPTGKSLEKAKKAPSVNTIFQEWAEVPNFNVQADAAFVAAPQVVQNMRRQQEEAIRRVEVQRAARRRVR